MPETKIQVFGGNVGIGTDDTGSYAFKLYSGDTDLSGAGNTVEAGSLTVDGVANSFLPTGAIMVWSGALGDIPSGWAVCDGNNGTPNLTERFALGTNPVYTFDATGGQATLTLTEANLPPHNHNSPTYSPTPAQNYTGTYNHTHTFYVRRTCSWSYFTDVMASDVNDGDYPWYYNYGTGNAIQTSNHTHAHPGNTDSTGQGSSFNMLPPYFALYYIMKL